MFKTITTTTTAPLGELVQIVGAMIPHVSKDRTRVALCAIAFKGNTVIATDSYTAARVTTHDAITTSSDAVLIDGKELLTALTTLSKLHKTMAQAIATISTDGHEYLLNVAGVSNVHGGQVINVEMPNVNHILKDAGAKNTEIYSRTGVGAELLTRIALSHTKYVGKDDVPLVFESWHGPAKPMLFTTVTAVGQLDQIVMPKRLK